MTIDRIVATARSRAALPPAIGTQEEQQNMRDLAVQAVSEVARLTSALQTRHIIKLAPGVRQYVIPMDVAFIKSVLLNGNTVSRVPRSEISTED